MEICQKRNGLLKVCPQIAKIISSKYLIVPILVPTLNLDFYEKLKNEVYAEKHEFECLIFKQKVEKFPSTQVIDNWEF